jgi:hypothetical protein
MSVILRATAFSDPKDANAVRKRRSTANRLLTILKAALNHAYHDGRLQIGCEVPFLVSYLAALGDRRSIDLLSRADEFFDAACAI